MLRQQSYAGDGFLGSSDPAVHFGLGPDAEIKEVRVHWSSGHTQIVEGVDVNQQLSVNEEVVTLGSEFASTVLAGGLVALFVLLLALTLRAGSTTSDEEE